MAWGRWKSGLGERVRWAGWVRSLGRWNPWKGLAALAVLGLLVWLGGRAAQSVQRAREAFPSESGRLTVPGLASPVRVLRDARGIPHIEAADDHDAWQALGLAHGQDRLAQILWLRRLARGSTAEVVGERGLEADRMARTLGLGLLADGQSKSLGPESRRVLEAYSAGLNAQIERIRSGETAAPLSLPGDPAQIRDWKPSDSIAVLKLIAWSSGNGLETGMVLDELIRVLGGGLAAPFRPGGLVEPGESGGLQASDSRPPLSAALPSAVEGSALPLPGRDLVRSTRIGGGTAWVLGGRHTESGGPILVADLHLPTTAPALVYEAHLRTPTLDVLGATIPGIPLFWVGRNPDLAWAAVPAGAVTVDLYMETIRESDGTYHDGNGWAPLDVRQETIRVRTPSGFRVEELTVRSTRHGPLVNGLLGGSGRAEGDGESAAEPHPPISLAWTGREQADDFAALLGVARAPEAEALRSALASHHEPVVAVVYADASGDAGVQLAGWIPQRTLPSSLVPVPARMRIYDWRGRLPYDRLPSVRFDASNSSPGPVGRGWVAFADGRIEEGMKASGIEWMWRPGERQRRLNGLLEKLTESHADSALASRRWTERVDLRTVAAIQTDLGAGNVDEVVPAILRLARLKGSLTPEAEEIASLLSRWDGHMGPDSPGGAVYSVLNRHLFSALFQPAVGDSLYRRYLALPDVQPGFMLGRVLLSADRHRARGGWADLDRVVVALRESLRLTWVTLVYRLGPSRADWLWAGLHGLAFRPFDGSEPLSPSALALGVGGDASTLATSASSPAGFDVASASSYRLAVDLAAPDRVLSALAPGQSEHPRHPHFGDGAERWLGGRMSLLLTSRLHVEEESSAPLLLEPPE
ncbi:MAG: penicillin acylase family protein [Myxococcota bacterium]|nr:penicillin acylase family protein [Myxococcota bacterium]